MTILDRLLGHDAWTTRQLLLRCRELDETQMSRRFDIGDRSLFDTFVHMIECAELHLDRMLGRPERELPVSRTIDELLARQSVAAKELAGLAARVERTGTADEMWGDGDGGTMSLGGGIAHLLTHSMHHRAQILYILEQLGVPNVIEGDALGWEGQARGWGYQVCNSYGSPVAD
jgi:uncharacterized damage-inducible protein DinB